MLLCPVEYCSSRAVPGGFCLRVERHSESFTPGPDVADSEYLATLGNTLHPDIKVQFTYLIVVPPFLRNDGNDFLQVFWTGANVVSATITASECHELAKV